MKGLAQRGDVWLVNWNPARGSEQAGKRPALIIQNDVGNQHASTTIVAALSTTIRLYPMNVLLEPLEGGLTKPSIGCGVTRIPTATQSIKLSQGILLLPFWRHCATMRYR